MDSFTEFLSSFPKTLPERLNIASARRAYEHTFTFPRSVIEDLGDGQLTAPVWAISRKLKETYGYVQDGYPKLKADWPYQGIEEMFVPVLEKAVRRERALNALRELIRLEDVGNTTLEELKAGLCWLQADKDVANLYQPGEERPSEIQLQMAEHEANEAGRIAAEKLIARRDQHVQDWRERRIRPIINDGLFSTSETYQRCLDLLASLRRLDIDEISLVKAASDSRIFMSLGEIEDALIYLNFDESISYMREGTFYSPEAGLAALTKMEGLLNRQMRVA